MLSVCYVVPFTKIAMTQNILARINMLKSLDVAISVICFEGSGTELLVKYCMNNGISIRRLTIHDLNLDVTIQNIPFLVSYKIREILNKEKYDSIRFVDFMGSAFHCIQGKRTCGEFAETTLAIDMYGSSQFQNEAGEDWGYGGFEQLMVQYMERYSCQFCDSLTSPTKYMYDWAIAKRWKLSENRYVIPNFCLSETLKLEKADISHLIFCGECSKAGGLHLFCNALRRLPEETLNKIKHVTYIGEMSYVGKVHAEKYIHDAMHLIRMPYSIFADAVSADSIAKCSQDNGILVFPQAKANNDVAVVTAAAHALPLIAAATEAHREILDETVLFDASPAALAAKIQNIGDMEYSRINHKYDEKSAKANWLEITKTIPNSSCIISNDKPLVSICIAFYNHGKFLEMTLSSIEKMEYPSLEIIVVNDGSTDSTSIEKFRQLKNEYQNKKYLYKFFEKANDGPSITRNYAAAIAGGEYLLFMDADNMAKPHMVSTFVAAMKRSECDCLTCYFDRFRGEGQVTDNTRELTYTLIGPSLELGIFSNCFGDTNFIVKRETFQKLGGFYKSRVVTEDWQFLSNLALSGFTMDVIPAALFWYRVLPESNVSFGSEYLKQQIILETYCKQLPPYVYHVFNSLCRPALEPDQLTNHSETVQKIMILINKILPVNTKRRNFVKKLIMLITYCVRHSR